MTDSSNVVKHVLLEYEVINGIVDEEMQKFSRAYGPFNECIMRWYTAQFPGGTNTMTAHQESAADRQNLVLRFPADVYIGRLAIAELSDSPMAEVRQAVYTDMRLDIRRALATEETKRIRYLLPAIGTGAVAGLFAGSLVEKMRKTHGTKVAWCVVGAFAIVATYGALADGYYREMQVVRKLTSSKNEIERLRQRTFAQTLGGIVVPGSESMCTAIRNYVLAKHE